MTRYEGNGSYSDILTSLYGLRWLGYSGKMQNIDMGIKTISLSFISAGYYESSSRSSRGIQGRFGVKNIINKQNQRYLGFLSGGLFLHYAGKGVGYSVRRVAKPPLLFMNKARSFSPTNFLCYNKFNRKGH